MEQCVVNIDKNRFNTALGNFVESYNPSFKYQTSDGTISVYAIENYYYRIESDLSTTVIFNSYKGEINIVVSGGSHGLFGITWGSERNMMKKMIEFFEEFGGIATWKTREKYQQS
ncbi:MAG: DUF6054 family protein [Promethearchaeota archaeon]